jgi:hypothetical protein
MPSPAYDRFIASMSLDFDAWHDGTGYDLDALDELKGEERKAVETLLVGRKDEDWRDTEALARLGTKKAKAALKASTQGPNVQVRLKAARALAAAGEDNDLEDQIVYGLTTGELYGGLAQAELLAEEHRGPKITRALLQGALCSNDGRAVRFVGLLFYHHGLTREAFAWSKRPYFLEFLTEDPAERRRLFDDLCEKLGVDGSDITCEGA